MKMIRQISSGEDARKIAKKYVGVSTSEALRREAKNVHTLDDLAKLLGTMTIVNLAEFKHQVSRGPATVLRYSLTFKGESMGNRQELECALDAVMLMNVLNAAEKHGLISNLTYVDVPDVVKNKFAEVGYLSGSLSADEIREFAPGYKMPDGTEAAIVTQQLTVADAETALNLPVDPDADANLKVVPDVKGEYPDDGLSTLLVRGEDGKPEFKRVWLNDYMPSDQAAEFRAEEVELRAQYKREQNVKPPSALDKITSALRSAIGKPTKTPGLTEFNPAREERLVDFVDDPDTKRGEQLIRRKFAETNAALARGVDKDTALAPFYDLLDQLKECAEDATNRRKRS